ncbi:MAG: sensor histidine kinase [Firmicutes bacterium]|nr:sensor histidine kinase [Bacillota bacterium]
MEKLTKIINRTIKAIENSQNQIFDIVEESRKQCKVIEQELGEIQAKTIEIIKLVEELEKMERDSRYRLMVVNKSFKNYSENEIKEAYEKAKELQLQLLLKKNEEQIFIKRRNELESRLKIAKETLKKAEKLVSQIGVVLGYLSGDLQDVNVKLEDIKEKQYLGIKVIKAQEEERYRLTREIHDGPAQVLANVILKSELCEKLIDIDKEKAKQELNIIKDTMRSSLKDVRKMIYDLRPMSLDDLGLVPTVEQLVDKFSKDTGIFAEFKIFGIAEKLIPAIELTIFRIVQEALTNVMKHSRATIVSVKIEYLKKSIKLFISDNGIGFDTKLNKMFNENNGYGLLSMQERVELLNGKFEIISKPKEGTRIQVSIPINQF